MARARQPSPQTAAVLTALAEAGVGWSHGYDLCRALGLKAGTVYPILSRLKRDGLVRTSVEESPEGPARKYYELTSQGEQLVSEMNLYWDVLTRGIHALRKERRS